MNLNHCLENNMKVKISDYFNLIGENHLFTEEYMYKHQGEYPVYSATLNKPVGYVDNFLFDKEILLIVNYGDAGKTTYLSKQKFNIGRNVSGLVPKAEYVKYINLEFLKYLLEPILLNYLAGANMGAMSQSTIKDIEFILPITNNGYIDINFQNKMLTQYKKITSFIALIKNNLTKITDLIKKEVEIEKYVIKTMEEVSLLNKGSNKISEENIYKSHKTDGIPVYSSATINDGLMGTVNQDLFNKSNKQGKAGELTWTTNGYAGVVFYRETDYLYSEKCGRIILRNNYQKSINQKYLKIYLNQITYKYKTAESNNGKLDILHMSNIPIKLPINNNGKIDIKIQNLIVEKYEKLLAIKINLEKILIKCNNKLNI
jgi:hypothetical protein